MKAGATNYVLKDHIVGLPFAIKDAVAQRRMREEKAEAELSVQESAEHYRSVTNSATDAIITVTEDGVVVGWNPAASGIFGYEEEEMLGKNLDIVLPMHLWDTYKDIKSRTSKGEQTGALGKTVVMEGKRKNGNVFPLELSISKWETARGRFVTGIIRDITERKQTEEQLRESNQIIEGIVNAIPFRVFWKDKHLVYLGCNVAFARDAGFADPKEIIGKDDYQLGWREQAELYRADDLFVITSGTSKLFIEEPQMTPEGKIVWLLTSKIPLRNSEGEITGVLGTYLDISERKRVEETLKKSEFLLRESQVVASIGSYETDFHNGRWVSSEVLDRLFGIDPEYDRTIQGWLDLVHPDDREAMDIYLKQEVIGKRQKFDREYRIVRPNDNEVRWVHGMGKLEFDENGETISMIGTIQDITDRRRAEEHIRQQAALIDIAPDAIIVRTIDDTILVWNQGAERMYGWSRNEAIGKKGNTLFYKGKERMFELVKEELEKKGTWEGELSHSTKDGRELTVQTRWTLMRNAQGVPESILSVNTDITQRKSLEAQFLRAQRLESVGTLAGGIAHDLNNVLGPVLLSLEVMRQKSDDPLMQRMINTIESSSKRGAELVKQVLTFAKGVEGDRVPVQIKYLIKEIQSIIQETFPKSISVNMDVTRDLWSVMGDGTQLHQVMMNLCVNARDAMPDGGRLEIVAKNEVLDEQYVGMHLEAKPGKYVVVSVNDSGIGMSAAVKARIFDPFYTTKETGKGTGLGLSTVMSIVKSHKGFVNLYSEVGRGTSFKVYLPAGEQEEGQQKIEEPQSARRGNGELILVVDDEEAIREITKTTLEAFGYSVVTASDGADAIGKFASQRNEFGLVLTDMIMPYMDGEAVIRALRRIEPDIRVLLVSGLDQESHIAQEGKGIRFLHKPYTSKTLLESIESLLASK